MGSLANTLFTIMLGWFQGLASGIWSAFTTEKGGSFLRFLGDHWIVIALILCAIGLAADFGVYLLRWRPFEVWKSFFRRRKTGKENSPEEPEETSYSFSAATARVPVRQAAYTEAPQEQEDDLARWKQAERETVAEPDNPGARTIVTPAGYMVPEDSPYRRPDPPRSRPEPMGTEGGREITETDSMPPRIVPERTPADHYQNQGPVRAQRRRRLRVGDLFNDPEEELREFDAPQHLIDRKAAYHEPVYPRGWKNNGEAGE